MRLHKPLFSSDPFGLRSASSARLPPLAVSGSGGASGGYHDVVGRDFSQFFLQQQRIIGLEDELASARDAIRQDCHVSPTCAVRNHEHVLKLTEHLFPGSSISVYQEADPEIGDDEYFAVTVTTSGEVDDIAARDRQWHRQICSVAPETATCYRLLIDLR